MSEVLFGRQLRSDRYYRVPRHHFATYFLCERQEHGRVRFLVEKAVLAVIHHADNLTFRGRPHDEALANSRGRPKQLPGIMRLMFGGAMERQGLVAASAILLATSKPRKSRKPVPLPHLSNTFDDAGQIGSYFSAGSTLSRVLFEEGWNDIPSPPARFGPA
jgi:hypothetical protein